MSLPRKPASLILAVVGALAMVVVVLVGSVWFLQLPFIARHIPTFEAPAADVENEPLVAAPDVAEVIPGRRFQPDCEALRDVLTFRIEGARGCQTHQQCGLSTPQSKCLTSFSFGLRAPIETAILEYNAQCGNTLPLAVLDAQCRTPDREWLPRCESNQCVLRELSAPWMNDN